VKALEVVSASENGRRRQLEEQFEVLKGERWCEGVVRKFEQKFDNRPEWIEEAVATAFERAAKTDRVFPSVDEVKKWLYVVAFNDMRRRAKREAGRPLPPWELERRDARSAEDEALDGIVADELYDELRWYAAGRGARTARVQLRVAGAGLGLAESDPLGAARGRRVDRRWFRP
jgi:DNA-directed RNA polymerase specialized sigma24 family protein